MTDVKIMTVPVHAEVIAGRAQVTLTFSDGYPPDIVSDITREILTRLVSPFTCEMLPGPSMWALADFGSCTAEMQCVPDAKGYRVLVHFCTPPPVLSDLGMMLAGGVNAKAGN